MTVIITTCTNRKRKPTHADLRAASLAAGTIAEVADEWGKRLRGATQRYPATELYGGRSFREATLAAERSNARMLVVSAGLGLFDATQEVPAYALTVLESSPDSIAARMCGEFSNSAWWAALKRVSPYAMEFSNASFDGDELILAALSDAYIDMISMDFQDAPAAQLAKLRLFTRAPIEKIPLSLQPNVMPYDDRLDGMNSPVRGTRSDFASRAMRHFAEAIAPTLVGHSAAQHANAVRSVLDGWSYPVQVERSRHDDNEIRALMRQHWDDAGGSTSRLLRLFRDRLSIACEQGRFACLAKQVRAERA